MVLVHSSQNESNQKSFSDYPDLPLIINFQPAIPRKSAEESDIQNLLAALHEEGQQITFTWCPSHCWVMGNEMADEQALKRSCSQSRRRLTPLRQCDGHHDVFYQRGDISHERTCRVYDMKVEKLDCRE